MANYHIGITIRKTIMNFTKQLDRSRFGTLLERSGMDSKPHQHEGVAWCIDRELTPNEYGGVRGGIMADEMGLGKTIQMLGVVLCNFKRRTLIILPKSLMCQWVGASDCADSVAISSCAIRAASPKPASPAHQSSFPPTECSARSCRSLRYRGTA